MIFATPIGRSSVHVFKILLIHALDIGDDKCPIIIFNTSARAFVHVIGEQIGTIVKTFRPN